MKNDKNKRCVKFIYTKSNLTKLRKNNRKKIIKE